MKIDATHKRALTGNDITVSAQAEKGEVITDVNSQLDEFTLADDELSPASESYQREFPQAGDAGPGMNHKLIVTVTTTDAKTHTATWIWVDAT